MHWTDLIARRYRFPPDAQVIADLSCGSCGYNLRGARVAGRCPECGASVVGSLTLIPRPQELADALTGAGKSCLSVLLVFFGCCLALPAGPASMLLAFAVVLVGTGIFRAVAIGMIRFRSQLHLHPGYGRLVSLLWGLIIVELLIAGLTIIAFTLAAQLNPGPVRSLAVNLAVPIASAWLVAIGVTMLALGRLAARLAGEFGYDDVRRRFAWLVVVAGLSPLLVALGALILVTGSSFPIDGAIVTAGLPPLGLLGAAAFNILLLAAQIVRTERLEREDLVDTPPRPVIPEDAPTPPPPDLPLA